jgi:Glycosyltransferases involved in cell wall biogenesis
MAQISVIVPVYNVEAYLRRCVDSILTQSFRDFELILVDDGSTDSGAEMCDAYEVQDARIHVIHQANGGVSAARNTGIDYAVANSDSGWLTFVDSDDWLHPEFLAALLKAAVDNNADVSVAKCLLTSGEEFPAEVNLHSELINTEELYNADGITGTIACGKLFAKTCFRELRFPNGKIHEDEYVTYRILFRAEQTPLIDAPLYAYYQNDSGITKKTWTVKRLDALEAIAQQVEYFSEHGFSDTARRRFRFLAGLHCDSIDRIGECTDLSREEKKEYACRLKKSLRQLLSRYHKKRWVRLWNRGKDVRICEYAYGSIHAMLVVWRKIKSPFGR